MIHKSNLTVSMIYKSNLTVSMIYKSRLTANIVSKNPVRFNQNKVTNTAKTQILNNAKSTRVILFRLCSVVVKFCELERIWEPTTAKGGTGHNNQFVRGN